MALSHRADRWLYRGGRPHRLAGLLNRAWCWLAGAGLAPKRLVRLEVTGRRTGRRICLPVVVADYQGERYLVSMLGEGSNWVRNIRAGAGRAVLRHGNREPVVLEEIEPHQRAPILRRYLECAPGARSHIPLDRRAPIEEFNRVAVSIPVFHITPTASTSGPSTGELPPSRHQRLLAAANRGTALLHHVTNAVVIAVLRSSLHPLLSRSVAVLSIPGRRTSRWYTFPVQYARGGQTLWIVSGDHQRKTWWRNLVSPAEVQVRLQGRDAVGSGRVLTPADAEFDRAMRAYLTRFPSSARLRGLTVVDHRIVDGDQTVAAATVSDVIVEVVLHHG